MIPTPITAVIPTVDSDCVSALALADSLTETSSECRAVIVVDSAHVSPSAQAIAVTNGHTIVCTGSRIGSGPARNLGARVAPASTLLFLDDDMDPLPGTVDAHLAFHRQERPRSVGLGAGTTVLPNGRSYFGEVIREWLDDWLTSLRHCCHYFDALCSSNFSVSRDLFWHVGGFDESFAEWGRCDSELGHRFLRAGANFGLVEGGDAVETYNKPPSALLKNFEQLGLADVDLAERWPELADELFLGRLLLASPAVSASRDELDRLTEDELALCKDVLDQAESAGETSHGLVADFWALADTSYRAGVRAHPQGSRYFEPWIILDLTGTLISPTRVSNAISNLTHGHLSNSALAEAPKTVRAAGERLVGLTWDSQPSLDLDMAERLEASGLKATVFVRPNDHRISELASHVSGIQRRGHTVSLLLREDLERMSFAAACQFVRNDCELLVAAGGDASLAAFGDGRSSGNLRAALRRNGVDAAFTRLNALACIGRTSLQTPRCQITSELVEVFLAPPGAAATAVRGELRTQAFTDHRPFPDWQYSGEEPSPESDYRWIRWCGSAAYSGVDLHG